MSPIIYDTAIVCPILTLGGRLPENEKMLESRSVGIRCVQENRLRGKFLRMIKGKTTHCQQFWIRNDKSLGVVNIFLSEKLTDNCIDIKRIRALFLLMYQFKGLLMFQSSQCIPYSVRVTFPYHFHVYILFVLLSTSGKRKLLSKQETSIDMLEVVRRLQQPGKRLRFKGQE